MQIITFILNFINWAVLSLLGYIFPRKRNYIVIFAPINGTFTDNAKYAYLWLNEEKDLKVRYITYDQTIRKKLVENGIVALLYPSCPGVFALLRASVIIGSATVPFQRIKGHLTSGAKLVQLWHGAGVKKVLLGSDIYNETNWTLRNRLVWFINRKLPVFDLVYFPSEKMKEIRQSWFRSREIKINGFVRNDILLGKSFGDKQDIFTDSNIINKMVGFKQDGARLILYAPTYRKIDQPFFNREGFIDLSSIDELMKRCNSYFIIKHHPWANEQINLSKYNRIFEYEKEKDVYPVLSLFEILVTDYSSIYSDYALLNKPVIHYIPDNEKILTEQSIHDQAAAMLIGPVFFNFNDFREYLELLLKNGIIFEPPDKNNFHDHYTRFSGPQLIKDVRRLAGILP